MCRRTAICVGAVGKKGAKKRQREASSSDAVSSAGAPADDCSSEGDPDLSAVQNLISQQVGSVFNLKHCPLAKHLLTKARKAFDHSLREPGAKEEMTAQECEKGLTELLTTASPTSCHRPLACCTYDHMCATALIADTYDRVQTRVSCVFDSTQFRGTVTGFVGRHYIVEFDGWGTSGAYSYIATCMVK